MSFYHQPTLPHPAFRYDLVTSPVDTGFSLTFSSTDTYAFEVWCLLYGNSGDGRIMGQSGHSSISVTMQNNNRFQIQWGIGSTGPRWVGDTFTAARSSNIEHSYTLLHILGTYGGSAGSPNSGLYVNGQSIDPTLTDNAITLNPSGNLLLGIDGLRMHVYAARVYAQAFSAATVQSMAGHPKRIFPALYEYTGRASFGQQGWQADASFRRTYAVPGASRAIINPRWGTANGFQALTEYGSPGEKTLNTSRIYYDAATHRSWIFMMRRGGVPFSRAGEVAYFDHASRLFQVQYRSPAEDYICRDNHQGTQGLLTPGGDLLSIMEDKHRSVGYLHRAAQAVEMSGFATCGTEESYLNLFYIGSSLCMVSRFGLSASNNHYQRIYHSTDDGASWDAGTDVAIGSSPQWCYPHISIKGDEVAYFFQIWRPGSGDNDFRDTTVMKTTDGVNFTNLDGSVSKTSWTYTELMADPNTFVISSGTDNEEAMPVDSFVDEAGELHTIVYSAVSAQYTYKHHNGTSWQDQVLPIPYNGLRFEMACLVHRGGTSWDFWKQEDRGNGLRIVLYQTEDGFATLDAGQVMSPPQYDVARMMVTKDRRPGYPVVVTTNLIIDTAKEQSGLWLHEYYPIP